MLKRQRPATPPLQSPTSFPSNSFDISLPSKRRCILGPSQPSHTIGPWEGDEDRYEDTEDEDIHKASKAIDSQYKDTNSFLYELHALTRHRQLFSQQSTQAPPSASNLFSSHDKITQLSQSHISIHPKMSTHTDNRTFSSERATERETQLESEFVRERYESTNRFVQCHFDMKNSDSSATVTQISGFFVPLKAKRIRQVPAAYLGQPMHPIPTFQYSLVDVRPSYVFSNPDTYYLYSSSTMSRMPHLYLYSSTVSLIT